MPPGGGIIIYIEALVSFKIKVAQAAENNHF